MTTDRKPNITLEYCVPCNYTDRAKWTASELESRFGTAVTLIPSAGGVFEVEVDGNIIFSKRRERRFPEMDELTASIEAHLSQPKASVS
jgi:selenoprotein W-related protein